LKVNIIYNIIYYPNIIINTISLVPNQNIVYDVKRREEEISILNEMIIQYLKEVQVFEDEMDKLKIDLAFSKDFNFLNAYLFFGRHPDENLSRVQFEQGLNKFKLYPTKEEINLIYKNYSFEYTTAMR